MTASSGMRRNPNCARSRMFLPSAHVGMGVESGIVRSPAPTTAKVRDSQIFDVLLHGEEDVVWANQGYVSAAREAAFSCSARSGAS